MKLEPTSQHSLVKQIDTSKPKSQGISASEENKTHHPKTASPKRNQKTKERLNRWFAQVGVLDLDGNSKPVDLIRQNSRREQILSLNKMKNLQNILDIAASVNIEVDQQENIDPDWFFTFAHLAEGIYSPAMQSLWGKIVAVEMSKPGSFSLRTLHLLTHLTQRDAKIFNRAASLASKKKSDSTPKLIIGYHRRPTFFSWLSNASHHHINIAKFGITYPDILSLIDMGLIFASEIETGELDPNRRDQWRCGDVSFDIAPKHSGTVLAYYKFTSVGTELYRLATRTPNSGYTGSLITTLCKAFEVIQR
jgi:uncharacterized repeat protein (TIGR03899 family)